MEFIFIIFFTEPTMSAQYAPHGTTVNVSWELSDSVYDSRNIMLKVSEPSKEIFTSGLIDASYRHHCISNLQPKTRYEIKVVAIFGCGNVSSELDILTQSRNPVETFPSQNCIVFNLTTAGW